VNYSDREKGETSQNYYQRTILKNIQTVLDKNKIPITPEIEADFKEVANAFGQDLGDKSEAILIEPLTGLYNRKGFEEIGKDRMAESKRYKIPLIFGYIDLDNFKALNDECGHIAGDNFLQVFGELLRNHLKREEDVSARLGGDEFGFIMFAADLSQAELIMNNLTREIKTLINEQFQGLSKPLGFSVGLEQWDGRKNMAGVMAMADDKLYQEKKQKYG
jgi:diguanylate cyclase (GGDEF)-like protein